MGQEGNLQLFMLFIIAGSAWCGGGVLVAGAEHGVGGGCVPLPAFSLWAAPPPQ